MGSVLSGKTASGSEETGSGDAVACAVSETVPSVSPGAVFCVSVGRAGWPVQPVHKMQTVNRMQRSAVTHRSLL